MADPATGERVKLLNSQGTILDIIVANDLTPYLDGSGGISSIPQ